jgi:hypothetical protein
MTSFEKTYSNSEGMGKPEHLVSEDNGQVKSSECTVDNSVVENMIWRKLDLYILPLASVFNLLSLLVANYFSYLQTLS